MGFVSHQRLVFGLRASRAAPEKSFWRTSYSSTAVSPATAPAKQQLRTPNKKQGNKKVRLKCTGK